MRTLRFSWGDTVGLRQIVSSFFPELKMQISDIESIGYPPYEGTLELVKEVKSLIKELTGIEYKNVMITAGATSAIGIALNTLKLPYTKYVVTRELYYPRVPGIITKVSNLEHSTEKSGNSKNKILLLESPSNPLGEMGIGGFSGSYSSVVWDGAYHSPVYGVPLSFPSVERSDVFVGSFGKFSGINGIRLGWLATDSDFIFSKAIEMNKVTSVGVSVPSQRMALSFLRNKESLDLYYKAGNKLIQDNKNEILRLSKIFGTDKVPNFGMFAFFETDNKILELFKKCDIDVTEGWECGSNKLSVRINAAMPLNETKEMVDRILKVDSLK